VNQRAKVRVDDGVRRRPETKSFILTSEFWVAGAAAAAVFLAGYALDDIAETTAWRYGTWIAIAYIISRGIAKAGSQRAYQQAPMVQGSDFWASDNQYRDDRWMGGGREDVDERTATRPPTRPPTDVSQSTTDPQETRPLE
jgi:hypothetical protein